MDKEVLEILQRLESKLDNNTKDIKEITGKLDNNTKDIKEITCKLDGVLEQTADLTEFRTDTTTKLNKLINVTKDNCFEIANLKIVK